MTENVNIQTETHSFLRRRRLATHCPSTLDQPLDNLGTALVHLQSWEEGGGSLETEEFWKFLGESPGNRLSGSVCNSIAHTNVLPGKSGGNLKLTQLASCISKYVIALNIANNTNDDYYCC